MSHKRRHLSCFERMNVRRLKAPKITRRFAHLEFEMIVGYSVEHAVRFVTVSTMLLGMLFPIVTGYASAKGLPAEGSTAVVDVTADGDLDLFNNALLRRGKRPPARKRGGRNKQEIEREQRELFEKTQLEVEQIIAEFHALLPREKAQRIGAIYARYSTKLQSSIPAQIRTMFEVAVRDGTFVPAEFVFYDLAVRGYKDRRPGFNSLQEAVAAKKFQLLLVFGTSRLFRKAHRAVKFVEEDLVDEGMNCHFIQQNIHTATQTKWKMMLTIQAAIDEDGTSMYAENIRAAHQSMFLRREVCTTLPMGYHGVPIEGLVTRRNRPKCRIAIDPEARPYVEKMYRWYVVEGYSIDRIAQLLNDDSEAPAPPKSLSDSWTHASVRGVLSNARYRGYWEYGKTYSKYQSKKDYLRQLPRDKSLSSAHFEELRIISDEVWYQAQAFLLKERGKTRGRAKKSETKASADDRLFWCETHDRWLGRAGTWNKSLACKECLGVLRETRPLYSQLSRELAIRLTCEKLAELIRNDESFVAMVVDAWRREANSLQRPDPARLSRLKSQAEKKSRAIQANLRNPGETEDDEKEIKAVVAQLRRERAELQTEIGLLEAAQRREAAEPNEAAVRKALAELGAILAKATFSDDETEVRLARRVLFALTGGKILLTQQGERLPRRGWLQGRFRVRLVSYIVEQLAGLPLNEDEGVEVAIDYRAPSRFANQVEEAWRLRQDEKLLHKEIALKLGCNRNKVNELLKEAAILHGVSYDDGRTRRSQLERKHVETTPFEQVYPEIARRLAAGELLAEIGDALSVSRWIMTKANKLYRKRMGLPPLDGRSRRKSLDHKNRPRPPNGT
jgi:DNA invertase Pin-like site-specific DNA recombinase